MLDKRRDITIEDRMIKCEHCEYYYKYMYEGGEEIREVCVPELYAMGEHLYKTYNYDKGKILSAALAYGGFAFVPHKGCMHGKRAKEENNGVWVVKYNFAKKE